MSASHPPDARHRRLRVDGQENRLELVKDAVKSWSITCAKATGCDRSLYRYGLDGPRTDGRRLEPDDHGAVNALRPLNSTNAEMA
jgi:hypothetical protein